MKSKPLIFVTNDDGINSPGIRALVEVVSEFGNLTIVAPDKPMSGIGHAITMRNPITVDEVSNFNGIASYKCSGTPVDCVKFGLANILSQKPDILVSGINHGSNSSINAFYSGTVAAAIEGTLEGISSVAFSIASWDENSDLTVCKKVVRHVISILAENILPEGITLNINIPDINESKFMGIMVCRQAKVYWHEKFVEDIDITGKQIFWLTGDFSHDDDRQDTDQWALENNYAAIVPIQVDLTAHHILSQFKKFEML